MNLSQENIDAIIAAHLKGELADDQREVLLAWIDASEENLDYFHQLSAVYHITHPTNETSKAYSDIQQKTASKKQSFRWYYAAAAVVAAIVISIFLLPTTEVIIASNEVISRDTLPDGSMIELAPHSSVAYHFDESSNKHQYKLEGSAAFNVKSHGQIQVITDELTIEDIGTIFKVDNAESDSLITVTVIEGIVKCYDEYGNALELKASEVGIYSKLQHKFLPIDKTEVFEFDFKDTKLSEVVKTLSFYYEKEIEVSPEIENCLINVRFSNEPLSFILEIISSTINADLNEENSKYKLTGNGCN